MKIATQILSLLIVFFMASCGNNQANKEQSEIEIENKELPAEERAEQALYDELMAVHDEAMPKMDDMMQLKGNLQQQLDMLREAEEAESAKIKELEDAINDLENASEGMMQWMRDFEPLSTGDKTHEEVMEYYKEKKESIEEVSQKINSSIEEAKKLRKE